MRVPAWVPVVLAAMIVGLVWLAMNADKRAERKYGAWEAIAKRLQRDSAAKAGEIRRADSVFVVDTIRFTATRTRYERVRDTVRAHTTDTVLVDRLIAAADTAIRACTDALRSCTARVAARDSLIDVLRQQRETDQRLASARLRTANPRLTPYLEVGADPLHSYSLTARGGAEMRLLGPIRLTGALDYSTAPQTTTRALVGVRVTF